MYSSGPIGSLLAHEVHLVVTGIPAASLILVTATLAAAPAALAQSAPEDQWHYLVEPYVMLPHVDGTVSLGNLPDVSVHASPGDIFSHLQFAAMLYAEAHDNNWAITSDLIYSRVAQNASVGPVISYGRVDLRTLLWEPALLYRVTPWLQAGAGADLTAVQTNLNLTINTPLAPLSASRSRSNSWLDPTVILRGTWPLAQKWSLMAQGNVGGFGVNSRSTWQAQLYAIYRPTELLSLSFGYRAIGDDYDRGSGPERFIYNTTTFGPVIRFGFNF